MARTAAKRSPQRSQVAKRTPLALVAEGGRSLEAALNAAGSHNVGGNNGITFKYDSLEEAFPAVDPGQQPFGQLVLVQIRQPKMKTGGGVLLPTESREVEHHNTQIAKVIAVGPIAFHNRTDMTPWPEGAWCKVGDFVRVPKYQGDRFTIPFIRKDFEFDEKGHRHPRSLKDEAEFVLLKDLALLSKLTGKGNGSPLLAKAFY